MFVLFHSTLHISTHSLTRRLTNFTVKLFSPFFISTHSLTRRLTLPYYSTGYQSLISTHSLTRRLTVTKSIFYPAIAYFNSQPHKEADTTNIFLTPIHIISTHSLTRRLTILQLLFLLFVLFQLTASQGG